MGQIERLLPPPNGSSRFGKRSLAVDDWEPGLLKTPSGSSVPLSFLRARGAVRSPERITGIRWWIRRQELVSNSCLTENSALWPKTGYFCAKPAGAVITPRCAGKN